MEKQKKWQFFLILAVLLLTIYNVLPTLFYYSKPLKSPISAKEANAISASIIERTENLKSDAEEWVSSFCSTIGVKPKQIASSEQAITVDFAKSEDASRFAATLPRAGASISFAPSQLQLASQDGKTAVVQRRIPASLTEDLFTFAPKGSTAYRDLIIDRAAEISSVLGGPSEQALSIAFLDAKQLEALALQIQWIGEISDKKVANRFAAAFTQGPFPDRFATVKALVKAFDQARDQLKKENLFPEKQTLFSKAASYLKQHEAMFAAGVEPMNLEQAKKAFSESASLALSNPLFSKVTIDWEKEQILLTLHADAAKFEQQLMNEAARCSRFTHETLKNSDDLYTIAFHDLPDCTGVLTLDLDKVSQREADRVQKLLKSDWIPQHPDLKEINLTVQAGPTLRIVMPGVDRIAQSVEPFPDSEQTLAFQNDLRKLADLLAQNGFQAYRGMEGDLVFEKSDLYPLLLMATREQFELKGSRKAAYLELSNVEQRILAANKIDTQIHEDLIKWQDEYNAAQVNLRGTPLDVPKPTKSIFWNNFLLSCKKFFRGDERKVIHWGLDLSGGKTVQVELRDANHKVVTDEEDLKQGINELYSRVNKMGVSEVAIRRLGNSIILDFPGSQSLSAAELIKASSMYFHVVNEKFSSPYSPLSSATNRFLTEVWNEAIVTGRKSAEAVNEIAWKHLHGKNQSESAKLLLAQGLVLQSPADPAMDRSVEDTTCKIAIQRGDQWMGHPLLVVFRNYALEGSQLDQIHPGYDPQKGNYLSFSVESAARDGLYNWTSRFSKEKVLGTPLEEATKGSGWRMAVILNDSVISAPSLEGVLRDSASITGSFSQREVNQLATDLKAGSLTFTPHILSEKNVSPELGQKDRINGILATVIALVLVVVSMIGYYRFAGFVASIAVLLNLLILWATLQNIGATLSLAGIAGIILTVGMAVDANVLVFERVKEEFAHSGRIATAIAAGYEKAYTAIIDSNVTTIIAALILLNFDAGPIKGFALTLIIGIASSMFTALFMTRYYFAGWVQNPKNQVLVMKDWVKSTSIDFLKQTKLAFTLAAFIMVAGGYLIYAERATIFGMDFTGGFSLQVEAKPGRDHYIHAIEKAFVKAGAATTDLQIRELSPSNSLRILFSHSMNLEGKPFAGMPVAVDAREAKFAYETNPRIVWAVEALKAEGIELTQASLARLEKDWTSISGQMSDTMRNNALLGLLISFVCIFIYIALRFEYTFAAASIVCLFHDVFITLGGIGILHFLGVPVQIDLNTVAAIMTIVGYSLNDTIIIFDRIREEMRLSPHLPLPRIVNESLNATLSRTTITSGTTLFVLLALVLLGGPSVFGFALVMTLGVVFGTLSSWYIASPAMLLFQEKKEIASSVSR